MLNTKKILALVICLGIAFKSEQATENLPLTRESDVFLAQINIGSPQKTFKVAIDPEKTAFWLVSESCQTSFCTQHTKFDSSQSTSFKNKNKKSGVIYRDLSTIDGLTGTDLLTLGNLRIEEQEFISATDSTGFTTEPYEGLLGVAYTANEKYRKFTTPLEYLSKSKASKNIFSFMVSGNQGELVLGDVDSRINEETIQYVPLNVNGEWKFQVSKVTIDDTTPFVLYPTGVVFSIDTTISFIGVPADYLERIANNLNAKMVNDRLEVDCSLRTSTRNIVFVINTRKFLIAPSLYINIDDETNVCSLNMDPIPQDYWVWGTPIIDSYYVVFDAEEHRIGFAKYPK